MGGRYYSRLELLLMLTLATPQSAGLGTSLAFYTYINCQLGWLGADMICTIEAEKIVAMANQIPYYQS